MNYLGRIVSNVRDLYKQINPATLSGAIDIIVVEKGDSTLACSPFYVKFGKLDVMRACNKTVDVFINGSLVPVQMGLTESGDAYFTHFCGPCSCISCQSIIPANSPKHSNKQPKKYGELEMSDIIPFSDSETIGTQQKDRKSLSLSDSEIGDAYNIEYNELSPNTKPSDQPEIFLNIEEQLKKCSSAPLLENDIYNQKQVLDENIDSSEPQINSSMSNGNLLRPSPENSGIQLDFTNLLPRPQFQDFKIQLSLCGGLKYSGRKPDYFEKHQVTFDQFISNPKLFSSPYLVVRINNRYYNWAVAAPCIVSYVAYNCFLPNEALQTLKQMYMPKQRKGWFPWRRHEDLESLDEEDKIKNDRTITAAATNTSNRDTSETISLPAVNNNLTYAFSDDAFSDEDSSTFSQQTGSIIYNQQNKPKIVTTTATGEDIVYPEASTSPYEISTEECIHKHRHLSSDELRLLNLVPGENSAFFSVTTRYQGTVQCHARIFLWKSTDKVVISDVDGTITKSDVLGLMLPLVGKDWTQDGVTKLFSLIDSNGYRILYLSARTIGIANRTRVYLQSVLRDKLQLPNGPILLSPTSLFESLHREVIENKPELFKIACLKEIRNLFPGINPFVAAFGNRPNDSIAYKAVNVPSTKIFMINHKGQIKQECSPSFLTTYSTMAEFVDFMFPLLCSLDSTTFHLTEYNDFFYWRNMF